VTVDNGAKRQSKQEKQASKAKRTLKRRAEKSNWRRKDELPLKSAKNVQNKKRFNTKSKSKSKTSTATTKQHKKQCFKKQHHQKRKIRGGDGATRDGSLPIVNQIDNEFNPYAFRKSQGSSCA
jgi:hypothetical protein